MFDLVNKTTIVERAHDEMRMHLTMPHWNIKEKIVLVSRILYAHGHASGLAGQITARLDESMDFWTQQMGLGMEESLVTNLLHVNTKMQVIEGDGMPNPANRFHTWIYRARPDVRCIIHTHPIYTSALSMLAQPLKVAHMDSCALYDDVGFLPKWPGIPVSDQEGETICRSLGKKRAVLLANHGLLVVSSSVEEACVLALQFEHTARLQLLAMSSGHISELIPALAMEAHDWLLNENRIQATFYYHARKILAQYPACLEKRR